MKLRTVNDLLDRLDKVFAWRLAEIHLLKTNVRTASGIAKTTAIRAGVPILYAHWEGFVKEGAEAMLNFVDNQRLRYSELKLCFSVQGLSKTIDALSNSQRHEQREKMLSDVHTKFDAVTNFASGGIRTKSNLSSLVFADIANSIGVALDWYRPRFNFIDKSLVERRNKIAHGEYLDLDENSFEKVADDVIALLRAFKNDLENSAVQKHYLK